MILLLLFVGQAIADPVTLEANAQPISQILRRIVPEGTPVACDKELDILPVVVRCKDVPRDELYSQIQRATGAAFFARVEDPTFYFRSLFRSRKEVDAQALGWRTKAIVGLQKRLADSAPPPSVATRVQRVRQGLSELRSNAISSRLLENLSQGNAAVPLLDKVVARLSPTLLAELRPGERVAFSNSPNSRQRSMPFNINSELSAYRVEFNEMWRGLHKALSEVLSQRTHIGMPSLAPLLREDELPSNAPLKLVLVLSRPWRERQPPLFTAGLLVVDANGAVLGRSFDKDFMAEWPRETGVEGKSFRLSGGAETVRLALADQQRGGTQGRTCAKSILSPEPLAVFPFEVLTKLAEAKKKNLIAVLPDCLLTGLVQADPEMKMGKVLEDLELRGEMIVEESDRWILIYPADLARARAHHLNRIAYEELLTAASQGVHRQLGWLASFFQANPHITLADTLAWATVEAIYGKSAILPYRDPLQIRAMDAIVRSFRTSPNVWHSAEEFTPAMEQLLWVLLDSTASHDELASGGFGWQVLAEEIEPSELKDLSRVRVKWSLTPTGTPLEPEPGGPTRSSVADRYWVTISWTRRLSDRMTF